MKQKTSLVTLTATVTDRDGRAVTDLRPGEIEVYEDKVRQHVEFYGMADAPVSVGVIFDLSGSMSTQLARAREALTAFIETSHPQDDYFLIGFQKQVRLLAEFGDGASMLRRLAPADAHGSTALYDAIYMGMEKVKQGRHRKHALLVISDGQDNASRYDLDELRRRMRETDAQIYCIGVNQASTSDKAAWREERRGQMILDTIAQLTGGRSFFVHTAEALEEATTRVALELRQQYSLGYVPTNAQPDGRWRKIRLRVNRPALRVRTREGYFASLE
ncbi:MAG: VWA domain-containing protein [Blastocatellia bacterium]|nr:VWA domain-containing protein [Blastocatellia bacterium]